MLLAVTDVAVICYAAFTAIKVLLRKDAPARVLRVAIVPVLLAVFHVGTALVYSKIPQWDFQDSLFDDLSELRIPGGISQECRDIADQGTYVPFSVSGSNPPAEGIPISVEEVNLIARIHDWKRHHGELQNRTAVGWRGWIQDTSRHGFYDNPERRLVTLFLHDPYASHVALGSGPWTQAVLYYFHNNDVGKLKVGQEVLVCGEISDADVDLEGNVHVSISVPVVNPQPLPEAFTSTHVPADFALEFEAHGCGGGYECDEYDLRVDAQGNITYRGYENVLVTGTHTARMSKEQLKQLVFELERTKFREVDNLPDKLEGNPKGATVIRVRMDGRDKTIVLPWESGPWSDKILMLIGKLEEVSDLRQWVTLVKSP
jgi:predicted secreted protein